MTNYLNDKVTPNTYKEYEDKIDPERQLQIFSLKGKEIFSSKEGFDCKKTSEGLLFMQKFYSNEKKSNEVRFVRKNGQLIVTLQRKSIYLVVISLNSKDRPENLTNLLEYANLVILS